MEMKTCAGNTEMKTSLTTSKYANMMRTILISALAFVVNYGINLVLTPYITDNVGTDAYGFVSLAKQFAQYATIITTALNSFAARYIALHYHNHDKEKANVYFSSVFLGDIILASTIMSVMVFVILFIDRLVNVPDGIVVDVKFLFLFVFVNFWITTVFSVFSSAAVIKSKLDIVRIFKGVSYVTEALILVVLYVLFPVNVFYVGLGLIGASVVVGTSNLWISKRYTPDLVLDRRKFSFAAIKTLVLKGVWSSVNSLGELLNNGLDLVVCNLMLSSYSMGQLSIAKMIHSIFASLISLTGQAFQPMLLKSYAKNDRKGLLTELKMAMKIAGMMSNVGFAGFAALGLAYYQLWIPNQDIDLIYKLTVITLLVCIPGGPMNPLYYIYVLTTKRMFPCMMTLSGGIFNVIAMYLLIEYTDLGVYAVVWTTAAVMFVINFGTNPVYMAHVLKMPWYTFYPGIIRNVIACAIVTAVLMMLARIYTPASWLTFVACACVFAIVGCILHLAVVFDRRDWKRLYGMLRRR